MTETEWLTCNDPTHMLYFLEHGPGWARRRRNARYPRCARKKRLFLTACARRNWPRLKDSQSREALDVAERFVDGLVDNARLKAVHEPLEAYWRSLDWLPDPAVSAAVCAVTYATLSASSQKFLSCIHGSRMARLSAAAKGKDSVSPTYDRRILAQEEATQADLLRDIFGNPFQSVRLKPAWLTSAVVALTEDVYESRTFDRLPILADALQDAGCENADVLNHCRQTGLHARGCWVVDLLKGQAV